MSWFRSKAAPGQWRNGAIGAAGSILLGFVLLIPGVGDGLKHVSYDLPFRFKRDKPPPDEVVMVYMDDKSHQLLDQNYAEGGWDRRKHAELADKLAELGARAVVFDVLWDRPWTNGVVDQQLANSLKKHRHAVIAAIRPKNLEAAQLEGKEPRFPVEPLRSAALVGFADVPNETDGVVRRQYSRNLQFPNLAWQTAAAIGMAPPNYLQTRWINYYGPRKSLNYASYYNVLDEKHRPPSSVFSNKVVFVGQESTQDYGGTSRDDQPTPYTRWTTTLTPGVEIQATAFLNLIHKEWIAEVSQIPEILICVATALLFGFGLVLIRPWFAALTSVAAFLGLGGISLFLFFQNHYWFPWLICGAAQIPASLFWAVLVNTRRLYHEKELLEQTLATARAASGSAQGTPATGSGPVAALSAINEAAALPASDAPTVLTPVSGEVEQGIIGDHELVRAIGRGAYGEVWLGKSLVGIYRAVKVVYRRKFRHAAPFEREFRGLKKFAPVSMSHRGFVQILHVGKNDTEGYFYYVMELGDDEVNGQAIDPATYSAKNLGKELKKRGSFSVRECLTLGTELSAALEHLHGKELIHRDIKPSNIIFLNGAAKLADVGLVTAMENDRSDITYVGTPGYIAPEGPGSRAADIFSLGKVLYECAMGRDCQQYPELPSSLLARSDKDELLELNKVISKACDPDPRCRYSTANELHSELLKLQNQLQRNVPVGQPPVGI